MIFEYLCEKCSLGKEVVKSASDHRSIELCDVCGEEMIRVFTPPHLMGVHFEPHFNHGLGEHVSTKRDYKELIKRKGLVEIGNENPESTSKYFDNIKKEKHVKSWESV